MNCINLAMRLSEFDTGVLKKCGFEITDIPNGHPVVQKLSIKKPYEMKPLAFEPLKGTATILVENTQTDDSVVLVFDLKRAESANFYLLHWLRGVLLLN